MASDAGRFASAVFGSLYQASQRSDLIREPVQFLNRHQDEPPCVAGSLRGACKVTVRSSCPRSGHSVRHEAEPSFGTTAVPRLVLILDELAARPPEAASDTPRRRLHETDGGESRR